MAKKLNVKTDDLQEKLVTSRQEVEAAPASENKKKRIGLYFDEELIEWLKATAQKKHCSVNNVVVQLILEAKEKEA